MKLRIQKWKKKLKAVDRRVWIALAVFPVWLVTNWVVQVVRKPSELVGIFEGGFFKHPSTTWAIHGKTFRDHATDVISPDLLAALAQVETRGNAIARTFWRWRRSWNPFSIYAPASSAVGLMQTTDATYEEARQYCIHHGRVAEWTHWYDIHGCWFNVFYNRLVPSHAVEMTSAHLHRQVERLLAKRRLKKVSPEHKKDLAALIHLCGPSRAESIFRRGFALRPAERCGGHIVSLYLSRVRELRRRFLAYDRPAFGPARPR